MIPMLSYCHFHQDTHSWTYLSQAVWQRSTVLMAKDQDTRIWRCSTHNRIKTPKQIVKEFVTQVTMSTRW